MDFTPIDHSMRFLRVRRRFNNKSLICAHTPTEEKNGNLDTFYDAVEKAFSNCPRNDVRIILGDFNSQVGSENRGRMVVGGHSLHKESNDNGLRLIGLAAALNMVIGSNTFPHKMYTWQHGGLLMGIWKNRS
jgi:hypothetical protein